MFEGCTFQTNVYGTFKSHKNRKHNLYTLNDSKVGIVKTNQIQASVDCGTNDEVSNSNADSDGDIETETEPQDLQKNIELNFASLFLKLEHCFHVPSAAIDELLIELHYLLSTTCVPLSKSVIHDVFENHNLSVDQLVIEEVSNALSSFIAL